MKKKLLAALLAAAMLTGLASATFAESTGKSTGGMEVNTTKTVTSIEASLDKTTAAPGEVVTVTAVAKYNDGTVATNVQLTYDASAGTMNGNKLTIPSDAKNEAVITIIVSAAEPKLTKSLTVTVQVTPTDPEKPGDGDNPGTDNPGTDNPGTTTPGGSNGGSSSGGSSSGGSSSGSSTTTTTTAGEAVSTTEATAKVEQAIAAADANTTVVVVRIRNAKSITVAALKAVLKAAVKAEKAPIVHADVTKDGKVESRLYIDPSLMKGNGEIKLGVTLGDEKVTTKFDKYFKNDIAVVKFDQTGSFGMSIKAAVKLDLSKLDTKALVFYSYNPKTNTYTKMTAPNYRIDANGYLHFTTSMGNCVIVTDQPLARK